jgi:DNA repair exonuclease SbcCD nuclease subunit
MKIAHLADLHLGYRAYHRTAKSGVNQREFDIAVAFRECVDKLIALKPDLILVAGDVFHTVRPANAVINFAFREFQRLHTELRQTAILVVAGNHESPRSRDTGCVLELLNRIDSGKRLKVVYNGVELVSGDDMFSLAEHDWRVLCVPHNAVIQRPKLEPDPDAEHNVLLIHAASDEYRFQARHGMDILRVEEIDPTRWDYVACGDYHSYTVVAPNMIYPGSIERTSTNIWAEASEPKGFVVYDLASGEHEFVELTSPRPVYDLGPYIGAEMTPEELDDFIEQELSQVDIRDAIVRIKLLDVPRNVARELNYKRIAAWRAEALHLQLDIRPPAAVDRPIDGTRAERLTLAQEFAEFMKQRFEEERAEALIELGMQYLGKAEEQEKEKEDK